MLLLVVLGLVGIRVRFNDEVDEVNALLTLFFESTSSDELFDRSNRSLRPPLDRDGGGALDEHSIRDKLSHRSINFLRLTPFDDGFDGFACDFAGSCIVLI